MIEVILKTKEKKLAGFQMSGHAGYDEYGKDIVCSAASIMAVNTINSLEVLLKLDKEIKYKREEDLVCLDIDLARLDEKKLDGTQLVMKSFELAVTSIFSEYQEFIRLYYREV